MTRIVGDDTGQERLKMSNNEAPKGETSLPWYRRPGNFKWATLIMAAILVLTAIGGQYNWFNLLDKAPTYRYPAPSMGGNGGFMEGVEARDGSLFFLFRAGFILGDRPLESYTTLNGDMVEVAVYSKGHDTLTLDVETWRVEPELIEHDEDLLHDLLSELSTLHETFTAELSRLDEYRNEIQNQLEATRLKIEALEVNDPEGLLQDTLDQVAEYSGELENVTINRDEVYEDIQEVRVRLEDVNDKLFGGPDYRKRDFNHKTWQVEVFTKGQMNEIQLPEAVAYTEVRISYDGTELWLGGHETREEYRMVGRKTASEVAYDRMLFGLGCVVVTLLSLYVVKDLVDRVKVVPHIGGARALMAVQAVFILAVGGSTWYIVNFAVKNILWVYIPIFLCTFLFGIWAFRPKYDIWHFIKLSEIEGVKFPTVEVNRLGIAWDGNDPINAEISWSDFLRGKRERVLVKSKGDRPNWWIDVTNSSTRDRLHYVESAKTDRHGFNIALSPIHQKSLEEYKAGLVSIERLGQELAAETKKRIRAQADSIKNAYELAAELSTNWIAEVLAAMNGWERNKKEEEGDDE